MATEMLVNFLLITIPAGLIVAAGAALALCLRRAVGQLLKAIGMD